MVSLTIYYCNNCSTQQWIAIIAITINYKKTIVGAFAMYEGSSFDKLIVAGKKLCLYALILLKGR